MYLCEKNVIMEHDGINYGILRLFRLMGRQIANGKTIVIDDNLSGEYNLFETFGLDSNPFVFPYKSTFTCAIVCVEGSLEVVINRKVFSVGPNDALIVQNGSILENLSTFGNLKTVAMAFAESGENALFNRTSLDANSYLMHRSVPLMVHCPEVEISSFLNLYADVMKLYATINPEYHYEIMKGFFCIASASFLSMLQSQPFQDDGFCKGKRETDLYLQFMDNLQLYGKKERTVSFYADKCCVSPKHLSKMIRQASGKSPIQLIKERVIIEAKVLLSSSDMTIRQIADELNFPTDSFFCRYFKEEVKMSPIQYRELSLGKM